MTSGDGRFTVYASTAPNLVGSQVETAVVSNIFLYDRGDPAHGIAPSTSLVSHTPGSPTTGADGNSQAPLISGDGRFVVYESTASNLVAGQTGPRQVLNVFLYDRQSDTTTLVSHQARSPEATGNGDSETENLTGFGFSAAGGDFLIFKSRATDLVQGQSG